MIIGGNKEHQNVRKLLSAPNFWISRTTFEPKFFPKIVLTLQREKKTDT